MPRARDPRARARLILPEFLIFVAYINCICEVEGGALGGGEGERAEGAERARSARTPRTPRTPRGARSTRCADFSARNALSLIVSALYRYVYVCTLSFGVSLSISVSRLGFRLVCFARGTGRAYCGRYFSGETEQCEYGSFHTDYPVLPSWLHPSSSPLASQRSVGRAQATEPHLHCGWPAAV